MKISQKLKSNSKFNPIVMLFYGLIVGAVGYIIIVSQAAPVPPTIYLNPTTQTFAINTTFNVDIRENSGTTAVNAIQANLSYPANLVDFVSIDTTNTAFTTVAQSTGGSGAVSFAGGTPAGGATVTGDQLVARVTFKTKTTGGAVGMAFTSGTALVSAASNTDILGSLSATQGGIFSIDTTAPTVSISSPTNGTVLAGGSTNTIAVAATDNSSVSKVEVLVDGVIKATLTTSPYNYSWNTTGLTLTGHQIQAKAYDPYGNTSSTAINTVTLTDQTAPTVSITTPLSNTTATGTVAVNVSAADNTGGTGIAKVELLLNGASIATDTTSPYSFNWDSKSVIDGSYTLSAKATDNASPANTKTSATVTVNVDNADHTPPSTPGSLRATSQTLTTINLAWNASTDNIGVTGYRIQRNGATLATLSGTTLVYNDSNLANGTSYNYSVVALDANNNTSTPATLTTSTVALKLGDVNGDNKVDILDLSNLLTTWGTSNSACDINKNGTVDIFDLSTLLTNFGT